jgi:hypothetical protein
MFNLLNSVRFKVSHAGSSGKEAMSTHRTFRDDVVDDDILRHTVRPFRYHLVDVAGREVAIVDRSHPLQLDETITLNAVEAWRVVAVLGVSATVAHA